MKKILLLLMLALLTGCAYLHDRIYDATDTITLAVEAPLIGTSAQFGSVFGLSIGAGAGAGLRSGLIGKYEFEDANLLLSGTKACGSKNDHRDKGYEMDYGWSPFGDEDDKFRSKYKEGGWHNSGQIEVSAGFLLGFRAGVNPFELIDFLLGWTTIDICNDDITTFKKKEQKEFKKANRKKVQNRENQEQEEPADE